MSLFLLSRYIGAYVHLKSLSESFGTSRTKPAWRAYTQKQMYLRPFPDAVFNFFVEELVEDN